MKKIILILSFLLTAIGLFAGGRQADALNKYMSEFESLCSIGKNINDLRKIPGIQSLEPAVRGAAPLPKTDWTFTDINDNPYTLTLNYNMTGIKVNSVRISYRSTVQNELNTLYNEACTFLNYYGAYNEYITENATTIFNGDRHSGHIIWGRTSIVLVLDDSDKRLFPSSHSVKIKR
jgi:hypothetical protein